jgi:hypothetical protein
MRGIPCLLFLVACSGSDDPTSSALRVIAVSPANDAIDVPLETPITIELSDVPPADFDVALETSTGAIEHAIAIDGNVVTLTPKDPLWIATDYTLAVAVDEPFASKFATRDGAWKNLRIASQAMTAAAPLGTGAAPSVAVLADGTVLAGWEGGASIFDQKFTPASGWLAIPNRLDVIGDPGWVEIHAATPTRALAAYERYVTRSNIEARTYNGSQWSAPAIVGPSQIGTVRYDQYLGGSAASEQTYALVYHRGDFDADQFDVYAAIHANGTWGAPFLVEDMPGEASAAKIVEDGRGGYVIVWIQRSVDRLSTAVWMRTLSATGTLGAQQLLDDGPGNTRGLQLARGTDTVWIAWAHERDDSTVKNRLMRQPFTASGLGTVDKVDLDGYLGDSFIQLDASARGALLVYSLYGGVFASQATNGTWSPFVTVEKISMTPGDEVGRPAIALDDRGNSTIVWTRVPQTGRRTTMVSRGRAGTWSQPAQLDGGTGSTYAWTAGVDAAGRVTTAWTQYDGTSYIVWGAYLQ